MGTPFRDDPTGNPSTEPTPSPSVIEPGSPAPTVTKTVEVTQTTTATASPSVIRATKTVTASPSPIPSPTPKTPVPTVTKTVKVRVKPKPQPLPAVPETSSTVRAPWEMDGGYPVLPESTPVETQPVVVVTVSANPVGNDGPSAEFWAIFSLVTVILLSGLGLVFYKVLSKGK